MKEKKLTIDNIPNSEIEFSNYLKEIMIPRKEIEQLHKQMKKELISKLLQELNVKYIVKGDDDPREIVNKVFKERCGV